MPRGNGTRLPYQYGVFHESLKMVINVSFPTLDKVHLLTTDYKYCHVDDDQQIARLYIPTI